MAMGTSEATVLDDPTTWEVSARRMNELRRMGDAKMSRSEKELHRAVKAGWVSVLKILLWAPGALVNARDGSNRTALHYGCESDHKNAARVVDVLVKAGAEVGALDGSKRTALHYACKSDHKDADRVVDVLLRAGAEVGAADGRKWTALHYACDSGHKDAERIVDMLVKAGADVDASDERGRTPLHEACASDHKDPKRVVGVLLWAGASVNVQDDFGTTPLHEACRMMIEPVVVMLLKQGARITLVDEHGLSPLHTACHEAMNSSTAFIVHALLTVKRCATGDSKDAGKHWAGHMDIKEILNTVNLQTRRHGSTALHLALQRSPDDLPATDSELFVWLITDGVVESERVLPELSVLSGACENNVKAVVSLLIAAGADVGIRNYEGLTALHYASRWCSVDIADMLVEKGAYVNAKDSFGNTPLHLTCSPDLTIRHPRHLPFLCMAMDCRARTIDYLLSRGAYLQVENGCQKTPYNCLSEIFRPHVSNSSEYEKGKIEKMFIKHVVKQKSLNLSEEFRIKWRVENGFYDEFEDRCCQELDAMKSTEVLTGLSLYGVLSHINQPYRRLSLGDIETIGEFITSPRVKEQFPIYYRSLAIEYERSMLLSWAVHSFYSECRKTRVLPHFVAEKILVFLSIQDLNNFRLSDDNNY